ncbi:MAG: hypothetical protein HQ475_05170 [SAR202 cluster bacterium]|nr:hypothetical protein [SAR202 cluster bacterium]
MTDWVDYMHLGWKDKFDGQLELRLFEPKRKYAAKPAPISAGPPSTQPTPHHSVESFPAADAIQQPHPHTRMMEPSAIQIPLIVARKTSVLALFMFTSRYEPP